MRAENSRGPFLTTQSPLSISVALSAQISQLPLPESVPGGKLINHICAVLHPPGESSHPDMAEISLEAEGVAISSPALFKKRSSRPKGNVRKRPATPPISSQDHDDTSDSSSSEDNDRLQQIHKIKKRKRQQNSDVADPASISTRKNPSTEHFPTPTTSQATGPHIPLKSTNDATKTSNWFDETENRKVGPTQQSSTNVRTTTVTDFAPDVCKDYKTTGWCGFGDSCKFLHDRGDYKQGWQLDRDWENVVTTKGGKNNKTKLIPAGTVIASAKRKNDDNNNNDQDVEEEKEKEAVLLESIPFACILCKQAYKSPIITRCGHYFCEPCALKRYARDPSCAACGASTHGVFNSATKLNRLLDRKRERERADAGGG